MRLDCRLEPRRRSGSKVAGLRHPSDFRTYRVHSPLVFLHRQLHRHHPAAALFKVELGFHHGHLAPLDMAVGRPCRHAAGHNKRHYDSHENHRMPAPFALGGHAPLTNLPQHVGPQHLLGLAALIYRIAQTAVLTHSPISSRQVPQRVKHFRAVFQVGSPQRGRFLSSRMLIGQRQIAPRRIKPSSLCKLNGKIRFQHSAVAFITPLPFISPPQRSGVTVK